MHIQRFLLCSLACAAAVAVAAVLWLAPTTLPGEGRQWQQWRRQQRITAATAAIDRLYNFQDTAAADATFSNHAGIVGQLTLELPDPKKNSNAFSLTEGRWPWKQSVRLRHAALHSRLSVPTRQAFSFHTWLRHFGEANPADSFYGTVCSVMSMGDGVHVGWCLQLLRPCNTLLFSIGQPKGAPAVSISSRVQIPEGLWTAVAGTCDGRELRLYVNGLLYAAVPWQGPYMSPKSHSRFRLGLAGNGSLAGCLEFDEVALFDRCLDATEIARLTWPELPANNRQLQPLLMAGERLAAGKPDSSVLPQTDLRLAEPANSQLAALHTIRRAEMLRQLEQFDKAQADFESLSADPSAPDSLRLLAVHEATRIKLGIQPNWRLQHAADRPDQWSLCRDYTGDQQAADQIQSALQQFTAGRWMDDYESHVRPLLQNRCGGCHSTGFDPDAFTVARLQQHPAAANSASAWERAFSQITTGQMPPPGHPPLAEYDRRILVRWWKTRPPSAFCEQIPTEQNQQHYPGYVRTRRLTRLEYRNAIRDLLGVQLRPEELPPADASGGEGFDTVGDVLFTSPGHLDSWMSSTAAAVRRALQQDLAEQAPENRRLLSVFAPQPPPETPAAADPELIRSLLTKTASQAWRRSPAAEEITQLLALYTTAAESAPSTLEAVVLPLQAILLSPHFLFIVEPKPADGSEIARLTANELATRLALLLWSSIPDAQLRQSADSGKLLQPSELRAQMLRMLDDPRSMALGEAFGVQWLGLDEAAERKPDPQLFPEYSPELAADFRQEAIRTIAAVFRENRSLSELLAADSVWVNQRLADFYGLAKPPAKSSDDWHRVSTAGSSRGGTAGMAAVLTATSYARRTSPVLRGKWLLQNLLGTAVEPPPPGIPALENADVGNQPATMRARLEAHRRDPDCAACHEVMDPLGFSLEHFDAIGRWRTHDNGLPVDASGRLPDGTDVNGPQGLKQALLARENEFLRHFTRRFLGYALGRSLTTIDDCIVERCLERLRDSDNRAHSLLEEVILSYPFQHRYSMQSATEP
ncbi:MAG: DUF1592 domain-containing protein [Planctomycetaceae bacterium]